MRAAHYNDKTFVDYTTWNNSEILLVPMIENANALADLEDICALPYVHMIVFAAGDLGFSLNEGIGMLTGPKVSAAYKQVLETAKRHNVADMHRCRYTEGWLRDRGWRGGLRQTVVDVLKLSAI